MIKRQVQVSLIVCLLIGSLFIVAMSGQPRFSAATSNLVQSAQSTSSCWNSVTSCTVAFSNPVTGSDTIIVGVVTCCSDVSYGISDSQSNTYTNAKNAFNTFYEVNLFYAKASSSSSDSITVTTNGAVDIFLIILEVSGINPTTAVTSSGTGTSSPMSVTSFNLENGFTFGLVGTDNQGTGTWTYTTGFTGIAPPSFVFSAGMEYNLGSVTGANTLQTSFSNNSGKTWSAVGISFALTASTLVQSAQSPVSCLPISSSCTVSFSNPVTAGDTIIVGINTCCSDVTYSISDSQGNTFTNAKNAFDTYSEVNLWYAKAASSASDSITISVSSAVHIFIIMFEVSGIDPTTAVASSGTGTSSPMSVTSFNLENGFTFGLVGTDNQGNGTWTYTTGFTSIPPPPCCPASYPLSVGMEYNMGSVTGANTLQTSFSNNSGKTWAAVGITFGLAGSNTTTTINSTIDTTTTTSTTSSTTVSSTATRTTVINNQTISTTSFVSVTSYNSFGTNTTITITLIISGTVTAPNTFFGFPDYFQIFIFMIFVTILLYVMWRVKQRYGGVTGGIET